MTSSKRCQNRVKKYFGMEPKIIKLVPTCFEIIAMFLLLNPPGLNKFYKDADPVSYYCPPPCICVAENINSCKGSGVLCPCKRGMYGLYHKMAPFRAI